MIIGFAIAAPVGPVGVLCIRRVLVYGVFSGLASGFGAALADGLYGAIAAFSLSSIADFLREHRFFIQTGGGLFLLAFGLKMFFQKPKTVEEITDANRRPHNLKELAGDLVSTFFITLTNPATILAFVAIFAGLGLVPEEDPDHDLAQVMIFGVFLGSLCWWGILAGGLGLFRHKLDNKTLRLINVLSGMIVGGFGAAVLAQLAVTVFLKA